MKKLVIIMSIFSFLFGGKAQQNNNITILDAASFKEAITGKKVHIIDVRTPNEFKSGHIKKAKNVDFFNQTNFMNFFNSINKEEPVYLYCRSGNRSQKAARKLDSLGFKNIYDLRGGYMNWK
jgi:rhodanese-related sulfurtransferase